MTFSGYLKFAGCFLVVTVALMACDIPKPKSMELQQQFPDLKHLMDSATKVSEADAARCMNIYLGNADEEISYGSGHLIYFIDADKDSILDHELGQWRNTFGDSLKVFIHTKTHTPFKRIVHTLDYLAKNHIDQKFFVNDSK